MLRMIIRPTRRRVANAISEPWDTWIKRTTGEAERVLDQMGIQDWVTIQRQRKWRWAAKVAGEQWKWGYKALIWDPSLSLDASFHRRQARPKTRWADDIVKYVNNPEWFSIATSAEWERLEAGFLSFARP